MSRVLWNGTNWRYRIMDAITRGAIWISEPHHEIHEGGRFYVIYSVASLGDMTTPDDMITLTFTTPNTTKWSHFQFNAFGTAGWRLRFIEAPSGGAESPTGSLTVLNHNRNSSNTSVLKDVAETPALNKISYDATLATGGTTLWDQYLEGSGGPLASGTSSNDRDERVLKQNTTYQVSFFGTDTNPATLHLDWYEHTNELT